jgi:hypothetical protein
VLRLLGGQGLSEGEGIEMTDKTRKDIEERSGQRTGSNRALGIMKALDAIAETSEKIRDENRDAWLEAIKLVLAESSEQHSKELLAHVIEQQRVYLNSQARYEGVKIMHVAAVEIYNSVLNGDI